ncbi:MAG: RNA methyltransferase [Betaproteobacteria bacterium]|nr:MAG: RNA methyltransferase [Betaproteobacteria bacterium]
MMPALERIRVVLCAPSHPGNIGGAARAMQAMGLQRLVLVNPSRFPDAEASALAAGALSILASARVVTTIEAALSGTVLAIGLSARPRQFAGAVMPVRAAAPEALRFAQSGDVALVFGTEMSGLSNAELERCQMVATIPTDPQHCSLNLAAAVQVAAYEIYVAATGGTVWSAPTFKPATQDEIEQLFAHGERTLAGLNFLYPRQPKRLMPRLRRLFARARLEKEEVNILRGILARIDQRLLNAKPAREQ